MREPASSYFDHVAIAAERWDDAFDLFVTTLGGRWAVGGDGGEFQPAQLRFAGGCKVEIVQPGASGDGFVRRFLDQRGPSPHHLTFRVADLDDFGETCRSYGFATMPGRDLPDIGHCETFVHPKVTGFGTLLQAVTEATDYEGRVPPPAGFREPGDAPHVLEWVALGVPDMDRAAGFLIAASAASIADDGAGWRMLQWADQRLVLLEQADPGVHHLLFRRPDQTPPDLATAVELAGRVDPLLGTRVLLTDSAVSGRA